MKSGTFSKFKFNSAVLIAVALVGIIGLSSALVTWNVRILSSGVLSYPLTRPLHVDGRYIKDDLGRIVYLRGIWRPGFANTVTGWWVPEGKGSGDIEGYTKWNETAVRAHMQAMKNHGFNYFAEFMWGDWWMEDKATTLTGATTDVTYRWAIRETLRIASEYGLYVQLRLYSPSQAEGRVEYPFPNALGTGSAVWTEADFIAFWESVATELQDYDNVIFTLYDEPHDLTWDNWFDTAERAINAIRSIDQDRIIMVHWAFCGSSIWIEDWINQSKPAENIIFSNHIYRSAGTFEGNLSSPTDIDYIRTQLSDNVGKHRAYKYIIDTYNVTIMVSAIGARFGDTDDDEYTYFKNTLTVLNEWNMSYAAYVWRPETAYALLEKDTISIFPPNRVGQALIDAIAAGKT